MDATTTILLIVILFLLAIIVFSFLGRLGLKTVKTFTKGRTATEKGLYFFTNIGILVVIVGLILLVAYFDFVTIPVINQPLNMDFLEDNIYTIAFIIIICAFLLITAMIKMHQYSTFKLPLFKKDRPPKEWER